MAAAKCHSTSGARFSHWELTPQIQLNVRENIQMILQGHKTKTIVLLSVFDKSGLCEKSV